MAPDAGALPTRKELLRTTAVFTAVLLVMVGGRVADPPYWDAAMSIFPAGLWLRDHGWDYAALLHQPGFVLGGPNVHALSLGTLVVATAYTVLGDHALVALHLLTIASAIWAATELYRLARHVLSDGAALATALVFMLMPPVITQAGLVYLEIPLMLCTLGAVRASVENRFVAALAWLFFGVWTKEAGAVPLGAMIVFAFLRGATWRARVTTCALLSLAATPAVLLFVLTPRDVPGLAGARLDFAAYLDVSLGYLQAVPDLAFVLAVALLLALIELVPNLRSVVTPAAPGSDATRLACALVVLCFCGFFTVGVQTVNIQVMMLPRYYVFMLPLAWLLCVSRLDVQFPRACAPVLVLAACIFLVNRNGDYYGPNVYQNGAIAERSGEYLDHVESRRQAWEAFTRKPAARPGIYGQSEHYALRWPAMRQGLSPVDNAAWILDPSMEKLRLRQAPPPPELDVFMSNAALDRELLDLLRALTADGYTVEPEAFPVGIYHAGVLHLHR